MSPTTSTRTNYMLSILVSIWLKLKLFCQTILNGIYTVREVEITDIPSTKPGEILVKDQKLLIGSSDYYLEIRILFSKYNGFFSGERFVSFTKLKET